MKDEFLNIAIASKVSAIPSMAIDLQRIYRTDYIAEESDSPQETVSSFSANVSFVDPLTPVFKYQRIESDGVFGSHGKAESAHLMSSSHCRRYKSYEKYDDDENNRLALSREMHGAYDALGFNFPVVNMEVVSVSEGPVLDNRFKVSSLSFLLLNKSSS
jgi:hypothetical protein